MKDALTVGLAILFIMAFTAWALSRILLHDAAVKAERAAERLEQAMYGYTPIPVAPRRESSIVLPPERRTRPATLPGMDVAWGDASPEQRAEAVLAVLPLHYEDSNGISAKDVAHRVGITDARPATRVSPVLHSLARHGKVRSGSGVGRRGKVYWKVGGPGG